jgi:hypothetical protein
MKAIFSFCGVLVSLLLPSAAAFADGEVLFEDNFDKGLSEKWQIVGLEKDDYRIRDGGLELRVPAGKLGEDTGMVKVMLPFKVGDTVTASVRVTPLDEFSEEGERAGVFLLDESGREFAAKKQFVGGKLVFAPGHYEFRGKPGEEGDVEKYVVSYTAAAPDAGPLRIIVRGGYGFFQVGPHDKKDEYLNFFHSALRRDSTERGIGLSTAGAPEGKEHWVRFDDFRVERN